MEVPFTNSSEMSESPKIASTIIYSLMGAIGIVGNGLVLLTILRFRELRTITNVFIINQSVIDMTSSIFLIALFVVPNPDVPKQPALAGLVCSLWNSRYIFWASVISSTFNLVVVTIERYLAVVYPAFYRNKMSYRRAAALTIAPWLLGFGYETYWAVVNQYSNGKCVVRYKSPLVQAIIGCVTFILTYLLPIAIMTAVYIKIIRTLHMRLGSSRARRARAGGNHAGNTSRVDATYHEKARNNVIKTLIVVCITYAICWTPNQIVYLLYNLGGSLDFNSMMFFVTVYLAFFNICINPFIYAFKYRKFQAGLRKLFRVRARD